MTKRKRMSTFQRKIQRILLLLDETHDSQQKDSWEYRVTALLEQATFTLDYYLERTTLDE